MAKINLTFPDEYYNPYIVNNRQDLMPIEDVKKEYSRLRSIANKRLQRFKGTEWESTKVYQINADKYKPIAEYKTEAQLRHAHLALVKFVQSERGSVSGLQRSRNKSIKTLRQSGYTFVNKSNYNSVMEFMADLRSVYKAHQVPSDLMLQYAFYRKEHDEEMDEDEARDHKENVKRMRALYEQWAQEHDVDPYGKYNQQPLSEKEVERRKERERKLAERDAMEAEILRNGTAEEKKRVHRRQYMREYRRRTK